jgi:glycosyltransferase involved in cell wall biosynthesis
MDFAYRSVLPGLSVVMPAYNEEENIEPVVRQSHAIISEVTTLPFELVVVNDGSRDRTGDILKDLCVEFPELKAVNHPKNLGYGQAVLTGIRHTRFDKIFFTDADLQFDLKELGGFLSQINDHDLIIGYRIDRKDPWHRKLYAYLWNKTLKLLFGLKVRDVDCAFKLFHRKVLTPIEIYSRGAMMSAEFLIRAIAAGNRLIENGVQHYPRTSGNPTGGKLSVIGRAFKELGKFWWSWYVANSQPAVHWPKCHLVSADHRIPDNISPNVSM